MRLRSFPFTLLAIFAGSSPSAAAPIADYLTVGTATLTITEVSSTADFVITIDPLFLDPEFNIIEDVTTDGSGNHEALAEANAALNALDPFDVGVGDSLVATASVGGFVDGPANSSADSLALPIIGLTLINGSLIPVTVSFDVSYSLSASVSAQAPESQSALGEANVFVDTLVNPVFEETLIVSTAGGDPPALVDETISFVMPVGAGEVGQLTFSTGAIGSADFAVPEPAAGALLLVGGSALFAARRVRRRR
ncbi:MAG: PEP-CTERM sorting domain-containing protein [Myxococcales bacterium]|nr:PEP-CTERM sorting domain-containing protein [Myxococcales bacterium]